VAAAYASEKLGLHFPCSYETACILQHKGKFREYLQEHSFNCPWSRCYESVDAAMHEMTGGESAGGGLPRFPVIVKPVDSAGSKGCSRANTPNELRGAIELALANSHSGAFVVEEYLQFESGYNDYALFVKSGQVFPTVMIESHFDEASENPTTPAGNFVPSTMAMEKQRQLAEDLQRLSDSLGFRTGLFDVEMCIANGGIPYIMEVSPRGGGCKAPELVEYALGCRLLENDIRAAVGMPLTDLRIADHIDGFWGDCMIHAAPGCVGDFERLEICPDFLKRHVRLIDLGIKKGERVYPYTGANRSLGDIFLHFDTRAELETAIGNPSKWMDIVLR